MSDFTQQKIPQNLKNILLNSFNEFKASDMFSHHTKNQNAESQKEKIKECVQYLKSKGFTPEDYERNFKN